MLFCSKTSLGSSRKSSLGMIYILRGEEGVSEVLTSLKKGMYKNVRRGKHKNVRKKCIKMSKGRGRVKNWPKFTLSG